MPTSFLPPSAAAASTPVPLSTAREAGLKWVGVVCSALLLYHLQPECGAFGRRLRVEERNWHGVHVGGRSGTNAKLQFWVNEGGVRAPRGAGTRSSPAEKRPYAPKGPGRPGFAQGRCTFGRSCPGARTIASSRGRNKMQEQGPQCSTSIHPLIYPTVAEDQHKECT